MWLRGDCSPCSLKCCLLDREVDLDKTRASLRLVGRNRAKGCRCLPMSHYLDLTGNCHCRTRPVSRTCSTMTSLGLETNCSHSAMCINLISTIKYHVEPHQSCKLFSYSDYCLTVCFCKWFCLALFHSFEVKCCVGWTMQEFSLLGWKGASIYERLHKNTRSLRLDESHNTPLILKAIVSFPGSIFWY